MLRKGQLGRFRLTVRHTFTDYEFTVLIEFHFSNGIQIYLICDVAIHGQNCRL